MNIEVTADQECGELGVVEGGGGCRGQPAISHCQLADSERRLRIAQNFIVKISIRIFNRNFPFFDRLAGQIRKMEQHAFTLLT